MADDEIQAVLNGTLKSYHGFMLPKIPKGAQTTIIPVPFPVEFEVEPPAPAPVLAKDTVVLIKAKKLEEIEVIVVGCLVIALWMLPFLCSNRKYCCSCFHRVLARRVSEYFVIGMLFSLFVVSCVIAYLPNVTANDVVFEVVDLLSSFVTVVEEVLTESLMVISLVMVFALRKKIIDIVGFDHKIIKADLRDILTCFTMRRFRPIQILLWKVEGIPAPDFSNRTLFARCVLGYNEPQHSRTHDGCTSRCMFQARFCMNYDPHDDTQMLSIMVKAQEILSSVVAEVAPVAGLFLGSVVNSVTPIGTGPGAVVGALGGVSAANAIQTEVARLDLSSARVNDIIRDSSDSGNFTERMDGTGMSLGTRGVQFNWSEDYFTKVDLLPQGSAWLRIERVDD